LSRSEKCSLCSAPTEFFYLFREKRYYQCSNCQSIMMDPDMHLSPEDEKKRYEQHNNDVNDPGYQRFVQPLVDKVQETYSPQASGLDYGAGEGPVATKLLSEQGYFLELYDPYFWHNQAALTKKYDFIVCCEVIEHFSMPFKEFKLLNSLLKPNGSIYCMTEMYDDYIDFGQWYYVKDPTHVFLYHPKALEWIKENFKFTYLSREGRLIHLKK